MADENASESSPEFHSEVANLAVKIALAEVAQGVYETGDKDHEPNRNYGPRVDEYQQEANQTLGQAWCAKFVYWCFLHAALQLKVDNPFPRIFGAAVLEQWGKKQNRMVTSPIAGDVLVKQHGHVGLVRAPVLASGVVPSVEGNTWAGAVHREGVYKLEKELLSNCTFIRL
jgi:hypothetical protein